MELLSDNYTAVAQTVNLLAEWLIMCGKFLLLIPVFCLSCLVDMFFLVKCVRT